MCWQVIRLLVLEDMKVIRSLCVPCFPPSYDIVNLYVQMYHKSLATHVRILLGSVVFAQDCAGGIAVLSSKILPHLLFLILLGTPSRG